MEGTVKDAVLNWSFDDHFLFMLVDLVLDSILSKRPLFPDINKEPVFYRRYFRRWIEEGMEERNRLQAILDNPASELE